MTDLLPCNNNRVIIPNSTSFYLDKSQDALFPDAIEANRRRMEEVMRQVESVRGLTGDAAATRRDDVACSSVEHMKSAVESLPALLEQKKELEKHPTNL